MGIELNDDTTAFRKISEFQHRYPPTKLMWSPDTATSAPDLLATTGDYLRLWEIDSDNKVKEKHILTTSDNTVAHCAPLTSFDWNSVEPSIIGTASIDTTCTIWNIETQQAITQLIAHDKEVYDIAFGRDKDIFSSVGADGSVRMFDIRSLDHSTIIYESPDNSPLLRLAWNKQDDHYLAAISMDSPEATILDTRVPSIAAAKIESQYAGSLNAVAWAPHSSCHICTAGDDSQALIWDLADLPKQIQEPILAYKAEGEINQLQWSSKHPCWISIAYDSTLQILKV